jgi:hypothetical protein
MRISFQDEQGRSVSIADRGFLGRGLYPQVLQDPSVSRTHAAVWAHDGRWYVVALASGNRSRLRLGGGADGRAEIDLSTGGARPLALGDSIVLGNAAMRVVELDCGPTDFEATVLVGPPVQEIHIATTPEGHVAFTMRRGHTEVSKEFQRRENSVTSLVLPDLFRRDGDGTRFATLHPARLLELVGPSVSPANNMRESARYLNAWWEKTGFPVFPTLGRQMVKVSTTGMRLAWSPVEIGLIRVGR